MVTTRIFGKKAQSLFAVFLALAFLHLGCGRKEMGESVLTLPSYGLDTISVFLTADIAGNLEPCGCKSGQIGGLPRQAQFILKNRKKPGLLLDVGNSMARSPKAYEFFKWYYILRVYERMGYDAVNLGSHELSLPLTHFESILQRVSIPFVSCNAIRVKDRSLLAAPYFVKETGGIKIGVTGITEPFKEQGEGIQLRSPDEALQEFLPRMARESHVIVLLANVSPEVLEETAQKFPQIGLIVNTGSTGTFVPRQKKGASLSSLSSQGQLLQVIHFSFTHGKIEWMIGRNVRLGENLEDHPGTVYILNKFKDDLSKKQFYLYDREYARRFAGAKACAPCHAEIYRSWEKTAHAHSLECLKKKKSEHDPSCLRCHVTGPGLKTGFAGEEKTPQLAFVGCESCHGPSWDHAYPSDPNLLAPSPYNPRPKERCLECHSWEHCENFDFDTFWAKIAHKK